MSREGRREGRGLKKGQETRGAKKGQESKETSRETG
jgi:hypothetical protein